MKKIINVLICLGLIAIVYFNFDTITNSFVSYLDKKPDIVIPESNDYKLNRNYMLASVTEDFVPYSYQDLTNIIYTILDNGWDQFTFYCPDEYLACINDLTKITEDSQFLTHISNYVHPYNSFHVLKTKHDESGEVTISVEKLYSDEEIASIESVINDILNKNINSGMSDYEKIKTIHDYIITHTKYDIEKNDKGSSPYKSNSAYGSLIEGYALCGGYTDAMAIFLNKFNIPNFKIASDAHVWNAVYYDKKWVHLDVTWDDQIDKETHTEYLKHQFLLIDTEELHKLDIDTNNHDINLSVYEELK